MAALLPSVPRGLPPNLPSVPNAKLPAVYTAATLAIRECVRIDECKDWADKTEALASYAKQAGNDELRRMADRIQARAIRRCGELLNEIAPRDTPGAPSANGGSAPPITRTQAAREAGLSRDQKRTALRIANVPGDIFEDAVESDEPPTITELARRGKKPAPGNLMCPAENDPEEFKVSTYIQGEMRRMCEMISETDPAAVVRGSLTREFPKIMANALLIHGWTGDLIEYLEKENRR